MKREYLFLALVAVCSVFAGCSDVDRSAGYAGSVSCRECHEHFYELWETSHHGKAMQPYTDEFAGQELTPQDVPIDIGGIEYMADIAPGRGVMRETGASGEREYSIEHVMGGKNVYFFLTPMERGRLQVMPLSYDVHKKEWYDTTSSMIRHFSVGEDAAVHWSDPLLTFNTSCYNCHVSQLSKNYDLASDTYNTRWLEPGINCETCHGPSSEHNRVCREAASAGKVPEDLKILMWKDLSVEQKNDACLVCHAKAGTITAAFQPGDRFFDHYDLTCFEDMDFYPDGRDLGENYTMNTWMMSPCVKSGEMDCMHCHTSSGRYRFMQDNPNGACLPCHEKRVAEIEAHSRHRPDGSAGKCIACHMPMTEFARMKRSDHSMRPPSPAATMAFKSPNACNLCHVDKDAAWADGHVRKWHPDGTWSRRVVAEGQLVQWARDGKWEHLREILDYVGDERSDEIVVTSLIRLLRGNMDPSVISALRQALKHSSPLVRSTAVDALSGVQINFPGDILPLLDDEYRLVRIRAAGTLMHYPVHLLSGEDAERFQSAEKEMLESMVCIPDQWSGQYNLGNYHSMKGSFDKALESYDMAIRMRPDVIMPYINASIAVSRIGDINKAHTYLKNVYKISPDSGVVNMNLGLLVAEQGDLGKAAGFLSKAMEDRYTMPQAAYNLAVITGASDPVRAVELCEMALGADPGNRKYMEALLFYRSRMDSMQKK